MSSTSPSTTSPATDQTRAEELAAHIKALQDTVDQIVAKGKKLGTTIASKHDSAVVGDLRKKLGLDT